MLSLYVRYAGQPPRCYRCGSDQHRIAQCPKPPSYRRCYTCRYKDHLHKHCPGNINRSSIVTATKHLEDVVYLEPTQNNAATQVSAMTENVERKADDIMNVTNQSISSHTSASGMESDQSVLIRRSQRKKRFRQPSPPDETSQSKRTFQEPQNHKKKTNFRRQRKNRNRKTQIPPIRI